MRAVVLTEVNAFLAVEEIPTPAVLGHEISGTVATVGPEVAGLAEGTRVVSSFIMPCGRCTQCAQGA